MLALAGIGAVVRHEPLAGDEVRLSISVHIDKCGRVSLRPGVVDHVPRPLAVFALLEPEHAVVVRRGGDDIVPPIAVDVHDVHEAEIHQPT